METIITKPFNLFNIIINSTTATEVNKIIDEQLNNTTDQELFILQFYHHLSNTDAIKDIYKQIKLISNHFYNLTKIQKTIPITNKYNSIDIFFTIPFQYLDAYLSIFNYSTIFTTFHNEVIKKLNDIIITSPTDYVSVIKYLELITHKYQAELPKGFMENINLTCIYSAFTNDSNYISKINFLEKLLLLSPTHINDVVDYFVINKQTKVIIKLGSKKSNNALLSGLSKEHYDELVSISRHNAFYFFYNKYKLNEIRLIALYELFEKHDIIIDKLAVLLTEELGKEELSKYIRSKAYTEEIDNKINTSSCTRKDVLTGPEGINTGFLSNNNIKESIEFLREMKKFKGFGIDTEWAPEISGGEKKNNESSSSDIIQIACENYICVIDVKNFNNELFEAFLECFDEKVFIGFSFGGDIKKMDVKFKDFFNKCKIIEIDEIYKLKKKKACPDGNKGCMEGGGLGGDKREQISNWCRRPLRKEQMNYCCGDAFVLLSIHEKL